MKNRQLFRIISFVVALALGYLGAIYFGKTTPANPPNQTSLKNTPPQNVSKTSNSSEQFANNTEVQGKGTVVKILSDDNDGTRHQRFILRLDSGQTVLVAHNIDLAPRIEVLNEDDTIVFKGVYINNDKGGVIHWTHRDPEGRHEDGWLKRNGMIYQ